MTQGERRFQLAYDLAERLFWLMIAAPFFVSFSRAARTDPWAWSLLAVETTTLALVLLRRPGTMTLKPWQALIAFVATLAPMLARPGGAGLITAGGALMTAGAVLTIAGKLSLNRRFGIVPANRGIQTRGAYAVVRHPIYASYLIAHLGSILTWPTWWNALVYILAWQAQIARLLEEEKFLGNDPAYQAYCRQTRYRLVPGLW